MQVYVMLTRLKLERGEGKLMVAIPQVRSRTRRASLTQSPPQILPQIEVKLQKVCQMKESLTICQTLKKPSGTNSLYGNNGESSL